MNYYYHLIKYILFLRLLRQENVSTIDIENSKIHESRTFQVYISQNI